MGGDNVDENEKVGVSDEKGEVMDDDKEEAGRKL